MARLRIMQLKAVALTLLLAGIAQAADLRSTKQPLVTES